MVSLACFILWMTGTLAPPSAWDAISWHRHEMLFGYTAAIIAGFLFTAVPNWTGGLTPKGKVLAVIVALWAAGRATLLTSALWPGWLVAAVDCSFLIACAGGITSALIKSGNRRNYVFAVMLLGMACANALTHAGHADLGIRAALNVIVMMMLLMGGRVIPSFTERPISKQIPRRPHLDRAALGLAAAALILDAATFFAPLTGSAFLTAALTSGWRLASWHGLRTARHPLLWILHAGYAWIVLGLALRGLSLLGCDIPSTIATHAFTAGGIGSLTLGMMARVSLGHSGRLLITGKIMTFSFLCVTAAAMLRVFGAWLWPENAMLWLEWATGFWLLAFGLYIWVYAPILILPRPDGRDG